jgi:hypothetical protein
MKNTEGITWMHVEKAKKIPEEIQNLPQHEKWYMAGFHIHLSRKGEYQAQAMAWALQEVPWSEMDSSFKNALSYSTGNTLEELKKENEFFHPTWYNPLARA